MKAFWQARMREPSTWRGLAMLISGVMVFFGYSAEAEKLAPMIDWVAGGMVASGIIGVLSKERQG